MALCTIIVSSISLNKTFSWYGTFQEANVTSVNVLQHLVKPEARKGSCPNLYLSEVQYDDHDAYTIRKHLSTKKKREHL